MSMRNESAKLESVMGRALVDADFRHSLVTNPEKLASDMGLSADEIQYLKHLNVADLEALSAELEGQISQDCLSTGNCM